MVTFVTHSVKYVDVQCPSQRANARNRERGGMDKRRTENVIINKVKTRNEIIIKKIGKLLTARKASIQEPSQRVINTRQNRAEQRDV